MRTFEEEIIDLGQKIENLRGRLQRARDKASGDEKRKLRRMALQVEKAVGAMVAARESVEED